MSQTYFGRQSNGKDELINSVDAWWFLYSINIEATAIDQKNAAGEKSKDTPI